MGRTSRIRLAENAEYCARGSGYMHAWHLECRLGLQRIPPGPVCLIPAARRGLVCLRPQRHVTATGEHAQDRTCRDLEPMCHLPKHCLVLPNASNALPFEKASSMLAGGAQGVAHRSQACLMQPPEAKPSKSATCFQKVGSYALPKRSCQMTIL